MSEFRRGVTEISVQRDYSRRPTLRLYIARVDETGEARALSEEGWHSVAPGGVFPCIAVEDGSIQRLIDELWGIGFRPSEGVASAGQSAAQEAHISDLRSVADRLLGMLERGL